jgi:hypothetical protein
MQETHTYRDIHSDDLRDREMIRRHPKNWTDALTKSESEKVWPHAPIPAPKKVKRVLLNCARFTSAVAFAGASAATSAARSWTLAAFGACPWWCARARGPSRWTLAASAGDRRAARTARAEKERMRWVKITVKRK